MLDPIKQLNRVGIPFTAQTIALSPLETAPRKAERMMMMTPAISQ
jgi:hypothetical protein